MQYTIKLVAISIAKCSISFPLPATEKTTHVHLQKVVTKRQ